MSERKFPDLFTYRELLGELEEAKQDGVQNHLLLGNGFNSIMGKPTDYESIFKKMVSFKKEYKNIAIDVKRLNYNTERYSATLEKSLRIKPFLNRRREFIHNSTESRIKIDFIKALHAIVRKNLDGIKDEKAKEFAIFLNNFLNYFTLNYDSFLHIFVTKFGDFDEEYDENLMREIEDIYNNGAFTPKTRSKDGKTRSVKGAHKSTFVDICVRLLEDDYDMVKIQDTTDIFWTRLKKEKRREKTSMPSVKFDDGFGVVGKGQKTRYVYRAGVQSQQQQNVYYLHGALHIMQGEGRIEKVMNVRKGMFEQLAETGSANDEYKNIICVFSGDDEKKKAQINDNPYLRKCYEALGNINGNVVVVGSSLSESDKHIFNKLKRDDVGTIYVSTDEDGYLSLRERAANMLKGKNVKFFDYTTISFRVN